MTASHESVSSQHRSVGKLVLAVVRVVASVGCVVLVATYFYWAGRFSDLCRTGFDRPGVYTYCGVVGGVLVGGFLVWSLSKRLIGVLAFATVGSAMLFGYLGPACDADVVMSVLGGAMLGFLAGLSIDAATSAQRARSDPS